MSAEASDTPPSADISPAAGERKHRWLLFTAAPLALAVLSAGIFFAFGGYSHWKDEESLGQVCQGILPKSALKSLMGSDDLRGTSKKPLYTDGTGWLDGCSAERTAKGGGIVQFGIGWSDEAGLALESLGRDGSSETPPNAVPIGNGWYGTMTSESSFSNASVILQCSEENKNLLVTAHAYLGSKRNEIVGTPEGFGSLARVVTETAAEASKKWGCNARLGNEVHSISPPFSYWRKPNSIHQPQGSCRSMAQLASEVAEAGGTSVIEAPVGNSLVEDCYVANSAGDPVYHLAAFYGPYMRNLGASSGLPMLGASSGSVQEVGAAWAYGECKSFFGAARFMVTTTHDPSADKSSSPTGSDLPIKLLRAFTKEAAERHGCSNLALP
ncbi:hypothetical protein AB0A70_25320 [Streptomyces morookaense]|uniref:hypothetical protein n=1 Tax=Streptomyces morookaense TaxID=1970 RepID=UPI0033EBE202